MTSQSPETPARREYDTKRWLQPVRRRDMLIAFIVLSIMYGAFAYHIANVQNTVRSNQCDVLNRLAETKLFIREFLREADTNGVTKERLNRADAALTKGINVLSLDAEELPGCELFDILKRRDRSPLVRDDNRSR